MSRRIATVFGGSGFLGRHLVKRLVAEGYTIRVAVRDPEAARYLMPMGEIDQILPVLADVTHEQSVRLACEGAEVVVNLVGILAERGRRTFQAIHVDGARTVAAAAKAAGARRLVHVSALGADANSESAYARSKAEGEQAVLKAYPQATILRPSVVFGPEDDFFNRFAVMTRYSPVLPVVIGKVRMRREGNRFVFDPMGGGGPKFQPVYVADVAEAIMAALRDATHAGKTFELAGPMVYSMQQIMEMVVRYTERDRRLVPIPMGLAAIQAFFLQFLPKPVLTPDQVKLMRRDNVPGGKLPGLSDLGITPTAAEAIVPTYLARFRPIENQITPTRQFPNR